MSESEQRQLEYISIEDLEPEGVRDIRPNVVSEIKERIEANGYNPSRPLHVVRENGHFITADGNHRLQSLHDLGHDGTVPCVVEPEGTSVHALAVKDNRDENTYAPDDLFDYLDRIEDMRESGLTQAEIAEELSDGREEWSRDKVKNHVRVLENVGTGILDFSRDHQERGVPHDGTNVPTFDFTEWWFRNSGIYDLESEDGTETLSPEELSEVLADATDATAEEIEQGADDLDIQPPEDGEVVEGNEAEIGDSGEEPFNPQQEFMEWFIEDRDCDAGSRKINTKTDQLAGIQAQLETLDDELNASVSDDKREGIRQDILDNTHTDDSLRGVIENANEGAKDRTYFGHDATELLSGFDANEFACVVTDPPYGVEYEVHHDTDRPSFGVDEGEALALLRDVLEECERVCMADAHLYVFFPSKLYGQVREVAAEFFDVEPVPLVWAKNNIAPTRDAENGFETMYAQQYETLLHLRAPKGDSRGLNGDSSSNLLFHDIPKDEVRWHDSQKPIGLWEELIENSTASGETILDPFAGSGAALLAAKRTGRHYVGIEQSADYEGRFKKELRKIESEEDGDSS